MRFSVENENAKYLLWVMVPFSVLSFVWIPLTWIHGNITSRSTGSMVYFFVFSFGFMFFVWIPALVIGWRNSRDHRKNFVLVTESGIEIALFGQPTRRLTLGQLVTVQNAGEPQTKTGHRTGRVKIEARVPWFKGMFYGMSSPIVLRVEEPEEFLGAVERLMTGRASSTP